MSGYGMQEALEVTVGDFTRAKMETEDRFGNGTLYVIIHRVIDNKVIRSINFSDSRRLSIYSFSARKEY